MITYQEGKVRFNYRAVAVALHGSRVLLHRAVKDDFWALPGGRGELLEPAKDTLTREMREELGVDIRIERLVWIVESFYEDDRFAFHELALYFLVTFPPDSGLYDRSEPFPGDEEGLKLIFQWFEIEELQTVRLYPTFLRKALRRIPEAPEHVVHTDAEE